MLKRQRVQSSCCSNASAPASFTLARVVVAEVDDRVHVGLQYLVFPRDLEARPVLLGGARDVTELAVNPSDAVRYLQRLITLTVALGFR
jgi:hypothetical protein